MLKFITSQPGYTIHILPNIVRSKGNQAMKFGQLRNCKKRNIFLQNHEETEGETSSRPHFIFKKALCEV